MTRGRDLQANSKLAREAQDREGLVDQLRQAAHTAEVRTQLTVQQCSSSQLYTVLNNVIVFCFCATMQCSCSCVPVQNPSPPRRLQQTGLFWNGQRVSIPRGDMNTQPKWRPLQPESAAKPAVRPLAGNQFANLPCLSPLKLMPLLCRSMYCL